MISMKQLRRRKWWLGIVLALSGGAMAAAQEKPFLDAHPQPPMPMKPVGTDPMKPMGTDPVGPMSSTLPVKPADDGKIEFEMREKRWNDVFEWLATQTGLTFNTNVKPPGTFTFI